MMILAAALLMVLCLIPPAGKDQEWQLLFDGSSVEEWVAAGSEAFPRRGWIVNEEEGSLICKGGGNLVSKRQFGDFELRLEFRINPGGNSGIFYRYQGDILESPEYQILDDLKHPDAKRGRNGNRTLAALYDVFPPGEKQLRTAGTWNTARIIAIGHHIEHWLNGSKVLEYTIGSQAFNQAVGRSKFSNHPEFARHTRGHIALQDHRDVVSFRNIRIRELN